MVSESVKGSIHFRFLINDLINTEIYGCLLVAGGFITVINGPQGKVAGTYIDCCIILITGAENESMGGQKSA